MSSSDFGAAEVRGAAVTPLTADVQHGTTNLSEYRDRVSNVVAVGSQDDSAPACRQCGGALAEHPPGHPGRPPKYCSVICRQAAHRARRRYSAAQPEHVKRPFRVALQELVENLRQHTGKLDQRLERYGAEAQALVELAVAVRDVAAAHDRAVGDSWTAVARRVDTTPAKVQDHCQTGLELVVSMSERG